ncbi:transporter [Flavobacterium sp.]|uniref:OmpP1/FadL family transporter n=1 Tax=Flavobacterium sp. TaxID=239 RepID=UPI00286D93CA|nr:transporter [Flavobacterium sp.]
MKKYISLLTLVLGVTSIQAQETSVADAFKFATDNVNGTARFRAMSGAMGALGGDMSALNVNPAGSVIFANNQISGSLSNFNSKNNSLYFGKSTSDKESTFDVNQAGGVFVFENNNQNSNWKKFALAVNYENNILDNKLFSAGLNRFNSGIQYFTSNANGIETNTLANLDYAQSYFNEQQATLAYEAFLINPVTISPNSSYVPNIAATGDYYQEYESTTTGYQGKLSFNAAAQYKEKLYLGLNVNSHFTDVRKSFHFREDYDDAINRDATKGIQQFDFNNELYTYGNGFSFQLGAIAKVTDAFRIGLAYESPTWMTINEELTQSLSSYCADCPENNYLQNPGITNVYAPYKISTVSKFTGSLAYIFGKKGLISFDYTLKDYSGVSFGPENDLVFSKLNQKIGREAREQAGEYRVGAEYRIDKMSLRGGYRFEQSPYKNNLTYGNLTGYSAGLGYNFDGTKLDLAYSTSKRNYAQQFFQQGMTDAAAINSKNNSVTLTLSFEL